MKHTDPPDIVVSVIVPVRDRRVMLHQLLEGLDRQTYRSFEVVVVDDGSRDGSGDLARNLVIADRKVTVLSGEGKGALKARRLGVEQSTGSILAFIDSDCIPDPHWLEHAVAAFSEDVAMVNGYTKPLRPLKPLERSMASGTEGLFPTCNMLYRRDLYERLGGFDAAAASRWGFRFTDRARGLGFGEDTLLGWQAVRSGASVRYAPEAVVEHQVFPPEWKEVLSRVSQISAFPAMTMELPELRDTLMKHRIFLGDTSRVPLYLALLASLFRRPRLVKAALAWWVLYHLREMHRSPHSTLAQLPWLPAEMAVDIATAGGLVAGSIRSRSLVL